MAETLPADLYIPTLAMDYARQAFVTKLHLLERFMGTAPGSPIRMMNDPTFQTQGQYLDRPVFKRIASLGSRRDLTSVSAVTDLELTSGNEKMVKVHKKLGGVKYSLDVGRVTKASAEEVSAEVGRQCGEAAAEMVQATLIAATIGALDAMTDTAHTHAPWNASARTNLRPEVLNAGLAKMGDSRSDIVGFLTRSEPLQDLVDHYLGMGVSGVADAAVRGEVLPPLGKALIAVDDSNLTAADAGHDKYHTLGYGADAVQIQFTLPLTMYPPFLDTSTEQVCYRIRGDFDYALGVRGMGYNSGAGGANPTDATLLSSANWSGVYSSHKEVQLIKITHNYSGN